MTPPVELPRPVLAEQVTRAGLSVDIDAAEGERAAIARRLMLPAIATLRCRWALRLGEGGMVLASGDLRAQVTQVCVATLEPFAATIVEAFDVRFVLESCAGEDDPDQPDEIVYDGTTIDLGEATVEQLALALDPYPRAPGAVLPTLDEGAGEGAFAGLAKLRDLN